MRRLIVFFLCGVLLSITGLAEQIRVTTWKLSSAGVAGEEKYLAEVAAVVGRLDPDVLLLQEVRDRQSCEKLAGLLQPANYQVVACSAFQESEAKRQLAILSKRPSLGAWAEKWKAEGGIDPPGGFAFAAIRHGAVDICFYSVQLKDNAASSRPDKDAQLNILKRELSARQLARHVAVVEGKLNNPHRAFVVAGDFNTSPDQNLFVGENTLRLLQESGFKSVFQNVPLKNRITRPGSPRTPDATFDFIFARDAEFTGGPRVTFSRLLSERLPVTCDLVVTGPDTLAATEAPSKPSWSPIPMTADKRIVWVGSAFGVSALALAVWFVRRRKSAGREPVILFNRPFLAGASPDSRSLVKISANNVALSEPQANSNHAVSWQRRAVDAEHRAGRAVAVVRAGLMPHLARVLRDRLLWKLLTHRSQLLNTQQSSAKVMAEFEQRLALVQSQFQDRVQAYERRIADLERELALKDKLNRELLGAKIQKAREVLEAMKSQGAASPES
jgi:endonuclease/exonuclease/phosphatase family metal-dependent hydrolase